jgi:hypothetical protein
MTSVDDDFSIIIWLITGCTEQNDDGFFFRNKCAIVKQSI